MKFCVVGAGAWGTAFALHLARGGRAVSLVPSAARAGRDDRLRAREPRIPSRRPTSHRPWRSCAGLAEGLSGADVDPSRLPGADHAPDGRARAGRPRRGRRAPPRHQPRQGPRAREPPAPVAGGRRGAAWLDGGCPFGPDQRGRGRARPARGHGARREGGRARRSTRSRRPSAARPCGSTRPTTSPAWSTAPA